MGHETIVVVGKRVAEPLSLAARAVSVIDRVALTEQAPRTVPEALWDAPGVFVQHTNYGGGSPIVRGLIGPQNLILVDGVRLNNSVYRTGPLQYLNLVDPQSIDRIEVLRGAGSVLYGSDAMGGVIQVTPLAAHGARDARGGGAGGRAMVRYSSADQGRIAHLDLDGRIGGLSALGGVTYKDFFDLTGGRGIGEQRYSGYGGWSAIGAVSYRPRRRPCVDWAVSAHYLVSRISDAGRTDKLYDSRSLQIYDNDDHLAYGRLQLSHRPTRTSGSVTLSYQHFFENKTTIAVADDLATWQSAARDDVQVDSGGLDLQLVTQLVPERLWLQYGGMAYRDWVDSEQTTWQIGETWQPSPVATYPSGSSYGHYGGFFLVEGDAVRSARGRALRLGGGYRLHGMAGHAPARATLPSVDFDHLGNVFFASAQYLHSATETLAVTVAQGFRAPNLNEAVMLGDTGKFFHVPNPGLGPERSTTVELAGHARVWRVAAGLAGYVSRLGDLMKREDTTWDGQSEIGGKPVAWNVNGGTGLLLGVEAELEVDISRGLTLAGSLTYTFGEEQIAGGADQPLTRIPPLFGQLKLRYETDRIGRGRLFAEAYLRAATDQDRLSAEDRADSRIPPGGTPAWSTWNTRVGWIAGPGAVTLTVDNLTNEAYRYHGSGVYAPGTNAMLMVEMTR